jgi:hypothetical protein
VFTFIGLIVVAFIILYKRSTEIIVVNPLRGQRQAPMPGDMSEDADEEGSEPAPSFAGLLSAIQQASQNPASTQGHAAIVQMVQNNQFIEAIQLYRRLYGVDLATAKKAVDKMMLER